MMEINFRSFLFAICFIPLANYSLAQETPEVRSEWMEKCPKAERAPEAHALGAGLIAIMAPLAVSAAVDAAGAAVQASAQTNAVSRSARPIYSYFYDVNKIALTSIKPGCIVIIEGIYDSAAPVKPGDLAHGLKEQYLIAEIELKKISGQPMYEFRPIYLEVNKFEDSSFWNKERRLDINLTLQGISDDKAFASAVVSFPVVWAGFKTKERDSRLNTARSEPFMAPELSDVDAVKTEFARNAKSYVMAMKYIEENGVTEDYAVNIDKTSIFSNKDTREAVYNYCRKLKQSESDSICSEWWTKGQARIDLQDLMRKTESSPSLIEARQSWAKQICPNYKPGFGLKGCPNGLDKKAAGYFKTQVVVATTRDANKYGMALAAILNKSSGSIGDLSGQYLPAAKKQANIETDEELRKANQEVDIAIRAENLAKLELDAIQSDPNSTDIQKNRAQLELAVAMSKVNNALVASGRSPKYTSL
jgi:hypothetical protein